MKIGRNAGWDMSKGYLFPTISRRGATGVRGLDHTSAKQLTANVKEFGKEIREIQGFPVHYSRSG